MAGKDVANVSDRVDDGFGELAGLEVGRDFRGNLLPEIEPAFRVQPRSFRSCFQNLSQTLRRAPILGSETSTFYDLRLLLDFSHRPACTEGGPTAPRNEADPTGNAAQIHHREDQARPQAGEVSAVRRSTSACRQEQMRRSAFVLPQIG